MATAIMRTLLLRVTKVHFTEEEASHRIIRTDAKALNVRNELTFWKYVINTMVCAISPYIKVFFSLFREVELV